MKILDRYLFKQLLFPFFIAISAFIIIGLVDVLFSLLEYVINRGVPVSVLFKLLIYKIPAIVVLFLPIATLFSIMLVLVRLIKDNELIIYWTAGVIYERVIVPIILFAIGVSLLSFYVDEVLVPFTNYKSNTLIHQVVLKESIPMIDENVFFKDVDNKTFYVRKINKETHLMEDVMIYEVNRDFPRVILAEQAQWNGKYWLLTHGKIHKYDPQGFFDFEASFEKLKIKVDYDLNENYRKVKNTKEMSAREINRRIRAVEKAGLDTKKFRVEYYLKYAFPFTNLVFAFVGLAFVFVFVRSSKDVWGLVISIIMALLSISFFFFLSALFRAIGIGGYIPPILAAWGPNFFFLIIGILLWNTFRYSS